MQVKQAILSCLTQSSHNENLQISDPFGQIIICEVVRPLNIEGSLSIGIAAHRDLVDAELPGLEISLRAFFNELRADFPRLNIKLISQLAEGGDQLAARIAIEMGFRLTTVLPMPQSEYERDFSTPGEVTKFRELLQRSDSVIEVPHETPSDLDLISSETTDDPTISFARNRQYARAGIFTSNHCQILLALWDGKRGEHLGGTGSVVHYHLTSVMEGFDDDDAPASLLSDDENDMAYHIVCSRNRPGGTPEPGLDLLSGGWLSTPFAATRKPEIPDNFRLMLNRLQEFYDDCGRYSESIRMQGGSLLENGTSLQVPGGAPVVDHLYRCADWLAIHYQKRVNRGLLTTYSLAVLMGLVFILYTESIGPTYLVLVFVAIFFAGYVLQVVSDRRQWHRKYLDYRALAEGLRVQLYWSLAGVVETRSAEFAYTNFLQKQDVELGWIRHVMRTASMSRDRSRSPDTGWVDWVIARWVGDEQDENGGDGGGQLAYYARKRRLNAASYKKTGRLSSISLWIGMTIALVLAAVTSMIDEFQRTVMLVLMGMLPLIAGVRDAYSHKKAEKELIKQYDFMARVFENARKLLNDSHDVRFQRRVLRALGQAALEEGAEWILMHRERPLEHGRI
jgi:hypothetical protein